MSGGFPGEIEHIVVLMLENRSFDSILGALYPHGPNFEGLKFDGSMANEHAGTTYAVRPVSGDAWCTTPTPDPGESFVDMTLQLFDTTEPPAGAVATMRGFVDDYAATHEEYPQLPDGFPWPDLPRKNAAPGDVMAAFTESQLPVTTLLAKSFGVSDAWFASCPTQTYPNRFFASCATSGGYVDDTDYFLHLELLPKLTSVFELLDAGGGPNAAKWKVYYHDIPLSAMNEYVSLALLLHDNVAHFDRSDFSSDRRRTFQEDVAARTLPQYSFIEPRYGLPLATLPVNSNHPPFDVRFGERLLADVYNTLRASDYYWPRTLLIITYDEHGGIFDHVIPPAATPPGVPPLRSPSSFAFDRYGVRVPAILVSPYIAPGSVIRPADFAFVAGSGTATTNGITPFDHTSIIRSVVECFNITQNGRLANLTQRDLNAPSLANAFTLNGTNPNDGLPSIAPSFPPCVAQGEIAPPSHLATIAAQMLARHLPHLRVIGL